MKIESAFVCDEVRKEDSGKLIFIGCYASDINVNPAPSSVMPIGLNLKLVLCGEFEGAVQLEVEVMLDELRLLKGKMKTQDAPKGFSFLPTPLPSIVIERLGTLSIKVKGEGGKWKEVRKIEVKSEWPIGSPTSS
jgi:hypothetical protein